LDKKKKIHKNQNRTGNGWKVGKIRGKIYEKYELKAQCINFVMCYAL
jgi:hypothetical protein